MSRPYNMLEGANWRCLQAQLLIGIQSAIFDVASLFFLAAVLIAVGLAPGGVSENWKGDVIWGGITAGVYAVVSFWRHSYRLGKLHERVSQAGIEAAIQD